MANVKVTVKRLDYYLGISNRSALTDEFKSREDNSDVVAISSSFLTATVLLA